VDKFDYLARDSQNLGLKTSYDYSILMNNCRVIDDELCFHAKEAFNVYEMFHTRYSLFKRFYSHNTSKAVEYMIMDALTVHFQSRSRQNVVMQCRKPIVILESLKWWIV